METGCNPVGEKFCCTANFVGAALRSTLSSLWHHSVPSGPFTTSVPST
jgi:hypothetical protein